MVKGGSAMLEITKCSLIQMAFFLSGLTAFTVFIILIRTTFIGNKIIEKRIIQLDKIRKNNGSKFISDDTNH
jgi:hypothetical protein